MTEQERIQALLQAGKITQQEADLLLSAVEGQTADQAQDEQYAPSALRWARVKLTAGRLEARLDQGLKTPVVEGPAEVHRVGADLEILPGPVGGGFLSGLLGSLELRLPPGWGLEIESKAAEVEATGIHFLKGRVAAGNVELEAVRGLDLEVTAGNIEGSLLLHEGEHRLRVSMGNAEVELLPGSSVRLLPSVRLGNQEIRGFAHDTRQLGEGRARLEVSVQMGNLEIEAK